jgi:hypothetical protein
MRAGQTRKSEAEARIEVQLEDAFRERDDARSVARCLMEVILNHKGSSPYTDELLRCYPWLGER